MKRIILSAIVLIIILLCSCTQEQQPSDISSTSTKDSIDDCYTSSCTMPEVYDEDYDTTIVGTFLLSDYTERIERQSSDMETLKETEAKLSTAYYKNYGRLDSEDFVRYAAIELFDQWDMGEFAPNQLKVYRDEGSGSWLVMHKNLEKLKMQQHLVFNHYTPTAVFTDDGKLLGAWNL